MAKNRKNTNGLKIIIVGCGKVGATLVEQLSREGHDITIIDKDPAQIQAVADLYDVMGIVGNGASYNVQNEAGIDNTDLFIAVTGSDELNLLCCTVAKRVGGCGTIARVRTPEYIEEANYIRDRLGLTMIINPEFEAASEVARVLFLPTALEINTFAHGMAEMVKIKIPEGNVMNNKTIASVGNSFDVNILITAVERDGELFIPSGNFIVKAGDVVSIIASRNNARKFLKKIGFATNQVKNTLIIGGGKAAYYLSKQLLNVGIDVKIIERDQARCEELSILLPEAIIINGDGTDEELLKEEGIKHIESFVPLTGIDEENIMLTLFAKQVSGAKVITKINRSSFKNVINSLDLGSVIYPRYITSEAIIAYVRAKTATVGNNIETLYHLFDSQAEAIEFKIDSDCDIIDIPLMKLNTKDNLLVALINRNGKIIIPGGGDVLKEGDSVVIVTKHTGFNDISDIINE